MSQCGNTRVILVHNHPSGDPTPCRADIEMTRSIIDVARPLGIAVHDHIIVGKDGHASLKALKPMWRIRGVDPKDLTISNSRT